MNGRQLARLLMASSDPVVDLLSKKTLWDVCAKLDASAVLCLADGEKVSLKAVENMPEEIEADRDAFFSKDCCRKCAACSGSSMKSKNLDCCVLSDAEPGLKHAGLKYHTCVPILLGSSPMGALSVFCDDRSKLREAELTYVQSRGKRLALQLHHVTVFPDLGVEWVELEKGRESFPPPLDNQRFPHSFVSSSSCSTEEPMDAPDDWLFSGGELPKGISLPTLRRVHGFLVRGAASVSRADISAELGFSDVTAGAYLKYLNKLGLVHEQACYGKVGRPTLMYSLKDSAKETTSEAGS